MIEQKAFEEFIESQPLRIYLSENGPMNVIVAGQYLDKICAALEYVHQHGAIHGSLSVDCIYVRSDGQILLENTSKTDLLALNPDSRQPGQSAVVGEGSAPEQLLGKPVGPFTDVYALGAILYHMLTGKPAFSGNAQELVRQHLFAPVPPLKQWRSDLPPGLNSFFTRAMAKNPARRFQQPGALVNAYQEIVDAHNENQNVATIISLQTEQVQLPFAPEAQSAEGKQRSNNPVITHNNNVPAHPPAEAGALEDLEDLSNSPTLKKIPALPRQTSLALIPDDISERTTLIRVPAQPKPAVLSPTAQDASSTSSHDPNSDHLVALPHQLPQKKAFRITANLISIVLLVLIASAIVGAVLFSKQNAALAGLITLFGNSKLLLGLCIVFAITFTVGFNIISRISLLGTKHEYAYTILWQLSCALLVPFFLPFDRFSINISPRVLLLFALSIVLWALVDAFLFSSFKYEEASVLSSIFPLNYVFTFAISISFFHSAISPTIVIGFLIIMAASLVIGLRFTQLRLSKGIVFALLYSLFQGVALGFNSEVVKSFSIPPYMFAAFLFPAIANLFVFLRPKVSELRYELQIQWKKILLNAVVMDLSFFFLLKAFELGNVPQVVALSASSTLLTALAGIVILKENTHIALKITAAALATLGIILVQL